MTRNPVPTIVVAQLLGTSLWFSANGAADDLIRQWQISQAQIGTLTNAVQFGFIVGTLVFGLSGLADRFPASRIFAVCALLGAGFNACFALFADGIAMALPLRFAVGFSLAGVYPLGMKLIVGWVPDRAGPALAQLVGMLTLGTALPHGIRFAGGDWSWQATVLVSSALAVLAAAMILRLGDGPHLRPRAGAPRPGWGKVFEAWTVPAFRASAFGYFGHMWELYALWTLAPVLIAIGPLASAGSPAVSGLSFAIVGIGAIGCFAGGWWSRRIGSARVAAAALAASALCCALFPFAVGWAAALQLVLLLFWGLAVVADSPHFSALSARACPPAIVGSALALQNAIGFAITMVSIQLGSVLVDSWGAAVAWLLLPGPLLALLGLYPLWRRRITV
ncbi:MFS transporter [Piscinibacter sakaiensis]|uniref:MFS transporter n=1 Tax=Piscinibacter sakaiensis TaxID=1547922 RepID=UPI003AAB6CD2